MLYDSIGERYCLKETISPKCQQKNVNKPMDTLYIKISSKCFDPISDGLAKQMMVNE